MPNAGNSSSVDFGMPDPQKCAKVLNCGDGQYFDGVSCISNYLNETPLLGDCRNNTNQSQCSTQLGCKWFTDQNGNYCEGDNYIPPTNTSSYPGDANSCPGFAYSRWDSTGTRYCQLNTVKSCQFFYPQYLDVNNYTTGGCPSDSTDWQQNNSVSGSCSSELTGLLGDGCHSMSNAWFDSQMTKYVFPGGSTVKNCTLEPISGCSSTSSYSACSYNQYWDGNTCVNNPSSPSTSCSSELTGLLGDGCHSMSNAWFASQMTKYVFPGGSTVKNCTLEPISGCSSTSSYSACSYNQYWDGNACVNNPSSPSTSCGSEQYWDGNTCGNNPSSSSTSCSSEQYWDGNTCVNNPSSPSTSCGSEQYWDGNTCVNKPSSPSTSCGSEQYWDGNTCVSPSTSDTSEPVSYFCPSEHSWNGSYCTLAQKSKKSGIENYTAAVINALFSIFDF